MRKVQFQAMIAGTTVKNGEIEEVKIDLRTGGTPGIQALMQILKCFKNGEDLTVTIEPHQLDMEKDVQ